jgi:hypothetical protein
MDSNKHSHNDRANNFEILENFKRFDRKNGILGDHGGIRLSDRGKQSCFTQLIVNL